MSTTYTDVMARAGMYNRPSEKWSANWTMAKDECSRVQVFMI